LFAGTHVCSNFFDYPFLSIREFEGEVFFLKFVEVFANTFEVNTFINSLSIYFYKEQFKLGKVKLFKLDEELSLLTEFFTTSKMAG